MASRRTGFGETKMDPMKVDKAGYNPPPVAKVDRPNPTPPAPRPRPPSSAPSAARGRTKI